MTMLDLGDYVDDRPREGIFRVHRDVYSDPDLFELELKYIFERSWCFLGLDVEIEQPGDYVTRWIARTPILLTRAPDGEVRAFINVCPHKGAQLAVAHKGCTKYHVCPYHGWAFDASGQCVDVKDKAAGAYPSAFDREDHNLIALPRLASYRGLIFGSLSADVPSLEAYLGDMRTFIDLAMDQAPDGMEIVPGRIAYTYRANWKLQMDNAMDQYHLTSTHASYMGVMEKRSRGQGNVGAQQFDWKKRLEQECGAFNFANGHAMIWLNQAEPQKRPIYPRIGEIEAVHGAVRAQWMLKARNSLIFPNMQIADATTLNVRTFRPIAVDKTEMRVHCIAPKGESPEVRRWRLRQFEDFFMPTGFASPDDTVCFESLQTGYNAHGLDYLQGYYRGIETVVSGADGAARELAIEPQFSVRGGFDLNMETSMHAPYRQWRRLMCAGMNGEKVWS